MADAHKTYTDREIDSFHTEIRNALERIENQTTKTNGRVTRLEFWKYTLIGMGVVIQIILIPIAFKVLL